MKEQHNKQGKGKNKANNVNKINFDTLPLQNTRHTITKEKNKTKATNDMAGGGGWIT